MATTLMLDIIVDIAFAADEARASLEIADFPSRSRLEELLTKISTKANALVQQLGNGYGMAPTRDMAAYPYARDLEITEVLQEIEQRLHALEVIRGPERDQELELAEHYAAPYALALFYEVVRLDSVTLGLLGSKCRVIAS